MGNATTGDKASRAYYYMTLLSLEPQPLPRAVEASLDRDLEDALRSTTESYALLRLAQTSLMRNDEARARAALAKATERCPCYWSYPDLKAIATQDAGRQASAATR